MRRWQARHTAPVELPVLDVTEFAWSGGASGVVSISSAAGPAPVPPSN